MTEVGERNSLIDFFEQISDTEAIDSVDAMADALLNSQWLRTHDAEVLRWAASKIYNGAGDPEQALYNEGGNPWLMNLAMEREHGTAG